MTIKQRIILGLFILVVTVIYGVIVLLCKTPSAISLCSFIGSSFVAGTIWGRLEEKWKRDKEMASLVAERLIGKPKDTSYSNGQMYANANAALSQQGLAQQANAMSGIGQGNNHGTISSLFGNIK